MKRIRSKALITAIIGIIFFLGMMPLVFADIYINVMAVNGSDVSKTTPVKFNLPGELSAQDILDTNDLQLEYNINDANYYVHGTVTLEPKESRTFKIKVRDVWQVTADQVEAIKKQVDEGYDRLGKVSDEKNADELKKQILNKLDYIVDLQNTKSDTIEKRIDSYRSYAKEIKRIQNDALSVEYWRSKPGETDKRRIIRMMLEVENPAKNPKKMTKQKHFLPSEVKPEHVVEAEGFEVRYDQQKQESFLFKEEELESGQKKKYSIGILDVWSIDQKSIDYLRSRSNYAYDFLKNSRFAASAQFLFDRIILYLGEIETSQLQNRPIVEHIGAFRGNSKTFANAKDDVEALEKLLAVYRENLEKSKVDNVLKKVKSLKDISNLSNSVLNKKFEVDTAWKYIGWVLLFVGFITGIAYIVWIIRSKDKKIAEDKKTAPVKDEANAKA